MIYTICICEASITHFLCVFNISNNYCRISDLALGDVFCPAPKHMIRLSVEYWQDSKIPIRQWSSLVEDTPNIYIYIYIY